MSKSIADTIVSRGDPLAFLGDGGEMGARVREYDWSRTPVGPAADWPRSLKTAVRILLDSRYPMFVWWGPDLINIYNDPYSSVLGPRHPEALGRSARDVWADIWPVVGPQSDIVLREGRATWNDSLLLLMERYGYTEETYFTFSYSPAPDDSGSVGGVFCVCTEDTQRVIGERQLGVLHDLAARTFEARTWEDACRMSAEAMRSDPHDIPFAMICAADADGAGFTPAATTGIEPGHPAVAALLELVERTVPSPAAAGGTPDITVVENLGKAVDCPLPRGAWEVAPTRAAMVPISATGETGRGGLLLVGLNPFRQFDDKYGGFLRLVAGQIASGIASAEAYEEERKRAEALAELDRAKTAFFSNVSHEFRTPLTLMLGPIEDLLENDACVSREARHKIEVVHRNSLRLLKLVNTILDFSRIESDRIQARFAPVDLAAYTAELASVFRSAVERAGLRLVVDCPQLPEPVYVDRDMWEKIVLNLLSNAFKYTLEGEIEVRLDAVDGHARLVVRDTGVGIPADEMSHIFERFHRVAESRGRTHEGTGIGLALVRELVRLHGGNVRVESELDRGTRFLVDVPLGRLHLDPRQIEAHVEPTVPGIGRAAFVGEASGWLPEGSGEDPAVDPERPTIDAAPGTARRGRVLWADDNADMREYVRRLLEQRFDVEPVADGEAALEAARNHPPDLVLSDVMMPRLDGVGLLHALRAEPRLREIPVILLSARAGEEARIAGIEAGADDYLIKPFSARELLARVEAHIRMARIRNEFAAHLEHEVADRTRKLETSNRELEAFVHSISHDLRAPLRTITGFSQILRRELADKLEPRTEAHFDCIEAASRRSAVLMDALLELSQLARRRMERRTVDLSAIAQSIIDELGKLYSDRAVEFRNTPRLTVEGDPGLFGLLLQNLLENAWKFTARKRLAIIEFGKRYGGGAPTFFVRDNGAGFDMAYADMLFGVFQRLHTEEEFPGTGIGLVTAQRIVQRHGGEIWAEAQVDHGATIYFTAAPDASSMSGV